MSIIQLNCLLLLQNNKKEKKWKNNVEKESKKLFDESQFIEWEGEPLHCSQHTSEIKL